MNIGGFMKQSFIDFPETLSAVIFTNGCNLNCWYCHNRQLINGVAQKAPSLLEIYNFLKSRAGFLEGVVISGGEPTLQLDLEEVIDKIKSLGFKIKLDTNGTNPQILQHLIDAKKIDYVAMDIKNSLKNYAKTANIAKDNKSFVPSIIINNKTQINAENIIRCENHKNSIANNSQIINRENASEIKNTNFINCAKKQSQNQNEISFHKTSINQIDFLKNIEKSIKILMKNNVPYEFRTTFSPDVTLSDIEEIGKLIAGASKYYLQKYNVVNQKNLTIPHTETDFKAALTAIKKYVPNSFLRGF